MKRRKIIIHIRKENENLHSHIFISDIYILVLLASNILLMRFRMNFQIDTLFLPVNFDTHTFFSIITVSFKIDIFI